MLLCLSLRTHSAEVVSSNPARIAVKMSLVRKATGEHLMNSTSLEK